MLKELELGTAAENRKIQLVLTVRVSVGKQRQKQEYYGDNAKNS
jgi:hypothetical protein